MSHNIFRTACKRKSLSPEWPAEFNPALFPIIACHVFGIQPAPNNGVAAGLVADPLFRHQVELLFAKGPRLPMELLAEVAIEFGLEDVIRKKLRRYLDIPDAALDVTGALQLPPLPIYAVQGRRP